MAPAPMTWSSPRLPIVPPKSAWPLVKRGARVIILTPVPRERERQLYTGSGASAYLPMLIDGGELMDTMDSVLRYGPRQPPFHSFSYPS